MRRIFQELDRDNSGTIEPEEIIDYLISENRNRDAENQIDDDMAAQLADEIMHNLDSNNDGKISLDEFADQYIEIIKKLRQRQIECEDKILDSYESYKHCKKLLEECQ